MNKRHKFLIAVQAETGGLYLEEKEEQIHTFFLMYRPDQYVSVSRRQITGSLRVSMQNTASFHSLLSYIFKRLSQTRLDPVLIRLDAF